MLRTIFCFYLLMLASVLSAQPDFLFAKAFDKQNGNILALHRPLSVNGEMIFAGYFTGTVDFDLNAGEFLLTSPDSLAFFLVKYKRDGSLDFAKMFPCFNMKNAVIRGLRADDKGAIYLSSSYNGKIVFSNSLVLSAPESVEENSFFVKFDKSGNPILARQLDGFKNLGFTIDQAGCFYLGGSFKKKSPDYDPGPGTFFLSSADAEYGHLAKYNPQGELIFARSFPCTIYSDLKFLETDSDSKHIYLGMQFRGKIDADPGKEERIFQSAADAQPDNLIAKLNTDGDLIWAGAFGGEGGDNINQIAVDREGNLIASGNFVQSADFDPGKGEKILSSAGNLDGWIARFDHASGNLVWVRQVGGAGWETIYGIGITAANDIIASGRFDSPVVSLNEHTEMQTSGALDGFCMKLDHNDGNLQWAFTFGSPEGEDRAGCTSTDAEGNFYLIGFLSSNSVDLDPAQSVHTIGEDKTAPGFFFAQYKDKPVSGSIADLQKNKFSVIIYPNPTDGNFFTDIGSSTAAEKFSVTIYNAEGKLVFEQNEIAAQILAIDASSWPAGIYLLEVKNKTGMIVSKKLVKK